MPHVSMMRLSEAFSYPAEANSAAATSTSARCRWAGMRRIRLAVTGQY
jgi:hypothetical protein